MATLWEFDARMGRAHLDLIGFEALATDGQIGRIVAASDRAGAAYVLVDMEAWLEGARRLLPAGVVWLVNENERAVHVTLTRDEVISAPAFDDGDDLDSPDPSYDAFFRRFMS